MTNSIERAYMKILNWLAIISAGINLITPLFPIFQVNIMGFSETELGIKYLLPFIDYKNESSFMKYLQDSSFLKILLSLILMVLSISAIIFCYTLAIKIMSKKSGVYSDKSNIKLSYSQIIFAFIINTIYYIVSVITVFIVMNDWHFKPVITYTYITFILQSVVLIVSVYINKHYKKALYGEVSPLGIGYSSAPTEKHHSKEEDKVNLLIKYKQLLDNEVITEEEYQGMKEKILKGEM